MSAERPPPVARPLRPAASSHTRPAEPFLPADDLPPETPRENGHDTELDLPPITLQQLHHVVITGIAGLHKRFDDELDGNELTGKVGLRQDIRALATRVVKLEADAQWKRWAIRVGKVVVTAGAGALAAKYPELAKALAPLLTGMP